MQRAPCDIAYIVHKYSDAEMRAFVHHRLRQHVRWLDSMLMDHCQCFADDPFAAAAVRAARD